MVLLAVNAEKDDGVPLAEEYSVGGYPTFVVTDAEGRTISRWWGFDGATEFVASVAAATADPTTIEEKLARFESAPTAADAASLGRYHLTRKEAVEATGYLERAVEMGSPEQAFEYDLATAYMIGVGQDAFTLEQVKAVADRALASPHLGATRTVDLVYSMVGMLRKDEPAGVAPYVAAGLAASENTDDADLLRLRRRLLVDEALLVRGDREAALALKRETLPEGWDSDPDALNGFAWWCFENELNLEEAEALARRGVDLAEDGANKAQILDTVAEIVFLRGDREGAGELVRQAIELDPDREYFRKQLERFSGTAGSAPTAAPAAGE